MGLPAAHCSYGFTKRTLCDRDRFPQCSQTKRKEDRPIQSFLRVTTELNKASSHDKASDPAYGPLNKL
eukprot:5172149-Amphidinium_carterae.1